MSPKLDDLRSGEQCFVTCNPPPIVSVQVCSSGFRHSVDLYEGNVLAY